MKLAGMGNCLEGQRGQEIWLTVNNSLLKVQELPLPQHKKVKHRKPAWLNGEFQTELNCKKEVHRKGKQCWATQNHYKNISWAFGSKIKKAKAQMVEYAKGDKNPLLSWKKKKD